MTKLATILFLLLLCGCEKNVDPQFDVYWGTITDITIKDSFLMGFRVFYTVDIKALDQSIIIKTRGTDIKIKDKVYKVFYQPTGEWSFVEKYHLESLRRIEPNS